MTSSWRFAGLNHALVSELCLLAFLLTPEPFWQMSYDDGQVGCTCRSLVRRSAGPMPPSEHCREPGTRRGHPSHLPPQTSDHASGCRLPYGWLLKSWSRSLGRCWSGSAPLVSELSDYAPASHSRP